VAQGAPTDSPTFTTLAKFSFLSNGYIPYYSSTAGITNSAMFQLNGNVGIGTTSPGATLDITGSTGVTGIKYTNSQSADSFVMRAYNTSTGADASVATQWNNGTANTYMKLYGSGYNHSSLGLANQFQFYNTGSGGLSFQAQDTNGIITFNTGGNDLVANERMRIIANGNVGIGTTTLPGTPKLGVNGTIGTYGLATDASNYQMGTLSASNGNGTLGSTTLSCVRAGTGAVNCDINLTPLGTGSVVINAGANILYRCVGGTGDGLISVNNANASCPVGTWTATSLKIN
jgi:hypothetical protein